MSAVDLVVVGNAIRADVAKVIDDWLQLQIAAGRDSHEMATLAGRALLQVGHATLAAAIELDEHVGTPIFNEYMERIVLARAKQEGR